MSLPVAISVEGLSKRYLVGHNAPSADRNATLRDGIVHGAKDLARKTRDMLSGRQIVQGDSVEEFWALRDVSFSIPQGARVGILGRNGAGKSTLLKLLSRITEPTGGRISINGRVASLLEVGTGFHAELSGRENIYLNGAILGMSRKEIQARFDEIVDFAEVERFLDTPVKRYSSGMYVRLAFAVAAHLEPEILIVDEVLAVGDAQFQRKCLGRMQEAGRSGRTIIFVSHNVAAVRQLCETVLFMRDGTVIDHCDVEGGISRYMEQGTSEIGVRVWPEGVGECVALHAVEVCNAGGNRTTEFTAQEEIAIRFRIRVAQPSGDARVGFRLVSQDGIVIFSSEETDFFPTGIASAAGEHELLATIPGGLLNEGTYSVTAAAHIPNLRILFFEESVLRFKVNGVGALGNDIATGRLGFIRPKLAWAHARIERKGTDVRHTDLSAHDLR